MMSLNNCINHSVISNNVFRLSEYDSTIDIPVDYVKSNRQYQEVFFNFVHSFYSCIVSYTSYCSIINSIKTQLRMYFIRKRFYPTSLPPSLMTMNQKEMYVLLFRIISLCSLSYLNRKL